MNLGRFERWLSGPAPARRLALFRILTGLFVVAYLVIRLDPYLDAAEIGNATFEPVGMWAWLDDPLPPALIRALLIGTLVTGLAFAAGLWFRITGPAFAVALLALTTYRSSGGQLLYFENLAVLHVLVVGCSPAADAMAVRRDASTGPADADLVDARYGWPLRLASLVTVVTYVLAGVAKLRLGGSSWLDGESLRNHVAFSAARLEVLGGTPSPLAGPLTRVPWIFTPLALGTLAIELGAPIALLRRRWRNTWVAAMWSFHAGIAATMFVVFPYPLVLIAFAPMFDLEQGWDRLARSARGRLRQAKTTVL